MLIASEVCLVASTLYFIIPGPPPEDLRFMGTTIEQIRSAVPGLEKWLQKVVVGMGDFMAIASVPTVFIAAVAMPTAIETYVKGYRPFWRAR